LTVKFDIPSAGSGLTEQKRLSLAGHKGRKGTGKKRFKIQFGQITPELSGSLGTNGHFEGVTQDGVSNSPRGNAERRFDGGGNTRDGTKGVCQADLTRDTTIGSDVATIFNN